MRFSPRAGPLRESATHPGPSHSFWLSALPGSSSPSSSVAAANRRENQLLVHGAALLFKLEPTQPRRRSKSALGSGSWNNPLFCSLSLSLVTYNSLFSKYQWFFSPMGQSKIFDPWKSILCFREQFLRGGSADIQAYAMCPTNDIIRAHWGGTRKFLIAKSNWLIPKIWIWIKRLKSGQDVLLFLAMSISRFCAAIFWIKMIRNYELNQS